MVLPVAEKQSVLYGHAAAEKTLLDLYANNTLAGSWLICGNKGIGKATLAFRLARFLLSQSGQSAGGLFGAPLPPTSLFVSPDSTVFKEVSMHAHPDLKVIERALKDKELKGRQAILESGQALDEETERHRARFDEIRVDDVRALDSFMHLTSATGAWRVVVVDAADDMNPNAANSLLKLLEEPKPKTVLLLVANQPASLLPTIRSRCRKIQLQPLSDDIMNKLLSEGFPELSAVEKQALCVLSDGSIGRASFLAENDGISLYAAMTALFDHFPDMRVPDIYAFTDARMKDKNKIPMLEELFLLFLARAARFAVSPSSVREACPDEFLRMRRLISQVNMVSFLDKIETMTAAFRDKDLDQKQAFVNACSLLTDGE